MKVDIQNSGSVIVAIPRDAVTEASLEDFQRAIGAEAREGVLRMVIDMANVPYVDSAGIEYLLELAGGPASGATRPRLAALTDTVREAFYLTETLRRFQVFDTVVNAVRSYV